MAVVVDHIGLSQTSGVYGVLCFFVLSGFLITHRLLLQEYDKTGDVSLREVLYQASPANFSGFLRLFRRLCGGSNPGPLPDPLARPDCLPHLHHQLLWGISRKRPGNDGARLVAGCRRTVLPAVAFPVLEIRKQSAQAHERADRGRHRDLDLPVELRC